MLLKYINRQLNSPRFSQPYASRKITCQLRVEASLTAHDKHDRPLRLTSAFQPLSAHIALASISISLPKLSL